jgi:hypothetical protein
MSARFQPDELVDVLLKGVCVVTGGDPSLEIVYRGGDRELYALYIKADSPNLVVTRVAPAEWPPRIGDLWADAHGGEWWCRPEHTEADAEAYLQSQKGGIDDPEWVMRQHGPMTLAYRKGWTPAPAADVDQADEAAPKLDERSAVIAGIRELADFLEAHPGLPVNRYTVDARHYVRHDRNLHTDEARHDELERLAAVMGVEPMPREAPYEGARHRLAVKKFSGGWGFEVCLTDAYQQPTDLAPGGNEVAGPVLVGPATARDLAGALDADPGLLADVHYMAGGTKGDPGECAAWCACGVTYSGFDTLGEASDHVEQHVANVEAAADEPCDRTDLPEDGDMMCGGCGERAGDHPAWRKRHGRHTPAVEADPDALDQLGVAATDDVPERAS